VVQITDALIEESLKEAKFPNTVERELKRGCAPLSVSSPSLEGKGINEIGPPLPNRFVR